MAGKIRQLKDNQKAQKVEDQADALSNTVGGLVDNIHPPMRDYLDSITDLGATDANTLDGLDDEDKTDILQGRVDLITATKVKTDALPADEQKLLKDTLTAVVANIP